MAKITHFVHLPSAKTYLTYAYYQYVIVKLKIVFNRSIYTVDYYDFFSRMETWSRAQVNIYYLVFFQSNFGRFQSFFNLFSVTYRFFPHSISVNSS